MRLRIQTAVVLPLLLLSVLPACSTIPPADEDEYERARLYELKFDHLAGLDDWNMNGRLAVRNEEDGGSGSFNWKHTSGDSRMDFHGALGRGAWRMTAWADGAELELADGTIHRAHSVNELVRQQLGWEIPVDSLSWWIRGMAAPGEFQERQIDEAGNLRELRQDGWLVEFGKYRIFQGISLPVRLSATQAEWKVKLAVRDWDLPAGEFRRD